LPPHADTREVPFIALGATSQSMSRWSFSIGWGSIPHDAYLIASWLRRNGHARVFLTWDRADHCLEYVTHFRTACARAGITILSDVRFPQIYVPEREAIFARTLATAQALVPDALVHFSTGMPAGSWVSYVTESGWDIPRIQNGGFYGASIPERTPSFEGWVGSTMWDDDNLVAARFAAQFAARYPEAGEVPRELLALSFDAARAVIEGVVLAPILTRDGVRRGLESLQLLPAACGGPRTCIGFSPHAHRGHQGPDVMVLRRVKDGRNIMEGRAELF
jgi:ABC-type branched-subunit amino acid transport system substrate-binding protein